MRKAFLRYSDAPALQRAFNLVAENHWDAWTRPEVVRFLVYNFSIAGGAAPAYLLSSVVTTIYEDTTGKLLQKYKEDKKKFILEVARMARCVPLVNFIAHDYPDVQIFGETIEVPNGTPLHASIQNANRDGMC
jgi:hypothetical protein